MFDSILNGTITMKGFLICMGVAVLLGICSSFIFMYRSRHSASLAFTLALLPMTVTMVIMLVNGNIGAGVAVTGAFALVRFRSIPGTAKEIAAIFTEMAIGLAIGMGYVGAAVVFFLLTAVITLALVLFNFGRMTHNEKQVKIMIPENYNYEGLFDDIFERYTKSVKLSKVRTTNMGTLYELTYDVVFPSEHIPKDFLDGLRTRNGNLNISVGAVSDVETL